MPRRRRHPPLPPTKMTTTSATTTTTTSTTRTGAAPCRHRPRGRSWTSSSRPASGLTIFLVDQIATCCLSRGSACTLGLLGTIVLSYLLTGLSRRCLLHLLSLILVSYLLDDIVPKSLPAPVINSYSGRTVVVTGANAGIGYEASRWLAVDYGARMIMGCRCRSTKGKCDGAAAKEGGKGQAGDRRDP